MFLWTKKKAHTIRQKKDTDLIIITLILLKKSKLSSYAKDLSELGRLQGKSDQTNKAKQINSNVGVW